MRFPDFVIIGAEKCGTTALWYNLDKHPDISMATKTSESVEMNFWGGPSRKKGIEWYKSKFKKKAKLCGEKSILYIVSKRSIRQIKENMPNAKLILCVRNPVDRAFSQWQMNNRGQNPINFNESVFHTRYAYHGKYYENLENNVFPFFDESHLHICVCEQMKSDPTTEMKKVFEFLGVDDLALPPKEIDPILRRHRTRKEDIVLNRKEEFYRVWSRYRNKMQEPLRKKLIEYYKPHNKKLFEYLGYKIKGWNK